MVSTLAPSKHQMPNHPTYHNDISGETAEMRLQRKGGLCYLFRYSKSSNMYQLAIVDCNQKVEHFELEIDRDKPMFSLKGTKQEFRSLEELIKYYHSHRLSPTIRNIGKPCYHPDYSRSICTLL